MAYIGLAFRAGRALAGTAACEKGVKKNEVRLLLMQSQLSEGTKGKFLRLCEERGIKVCVLEEPGSIGRAIGRQEIMLVGVTDQRLANAARNIIDGVKGSGLNE